jgi:hypothetical protein
MNKFYQGIVDFMFLIDPINLVHRENSSMFSSGDLKPKVAIWFEHYLIPIRIGTVLRFVLSAQGPGSTGSAFGPSSFCEGSE